MRALLLAAALLPLGIAGFANADHVGIGYNITVWCSFMAPQEAGCEHAETFGFQHIHMFGVTPAVGASFPPDATMTVTIAGTTAFTHAPFSLTYTCDLGTNVYTPQPRTAVARVDGLVDQWLGDLSMHRTCGSGPSSFHHNFVGAVTLTASAGDGVHALVDAWIAK